MLPFALSVAILLCIGGVVEAFPHADKRHTEVKSLNWAPCNLDFPERAKEGIITPVDCAKLGVPLDYTDPSNKQTIELQLVKINATKEPVQGSIIFNPGGPGGSGVQEVSTKGSAYRDVFGGHFNVIGFDTRGTGKTIPFVCDLSQGKQNSPRREFTTSPQKDLYSVLQRKAWHDGGILADACGKSQRETGRFLGTTFVARDLLQIVDALNEDGLLRFWGRSYSTDLGQTFAAMFPDRVGRILLDSVQKADDYWAGRWLTANRDTETALLNFFSDCIKAGTKICPIANYTGPETTSHILLSSLAEVFQEIIDDPITLPDSYPVTAAQWWQPGNMDLYLEFKNLLFSQLYRPDQYFAVLDLVSGALDRNWTAWLTEQPTPTPKPAPQWNEGIHNFHGIACADGLFRAENQEDMYSLIQAQQAQDSWADAFVPQQWPCAQWPWHAAERYTSGFDNITTNFPIMLVNSPYDPITPLSGAWEVSAGFKGSRVLVHEGHGHGVMNHPSNCTIKAIGEYFANGTLPEHGTRCKPNQPAFEIALAALKAQGAESDGDS
ncbi:Fc.00g108030.m01.CDS01 [Cosmosporella sp. VM-42]